MGLACKRLVRGGLSAKNGFLWAFPLGKKQYWPGNESLKWTNPQGRNDPNCPMKQELFLCQQFSSDKSIEKFEAV